MVDSSTQITATGVAPDDGGSPITSYDWRHRVRGSGGSGWVDRSNVTNLTQSFSGLDASTEYDFRFRATNIVGNSPYSFPVRETTEDAPPVTVDHAVAGGDLSWGFEIPEATVTHVAATPGTVSLTGFTSGVTFIRWSDDQLLGSDFSLDGGDQTLSDAFMWYTGGAAGQVGIYLSGVNARFTADFEATGTFTFTASDGETLEVQIADASMTEPYLWTPTNGVDVIAFANHVISLTDHDATLTLTSGGPPATQDHAVDGGNLSWGFTIPQATVTVMRAAGTTDYAINGGDLDWGFAIPQATITIVRAAAAVDHAVDGGSIAWGFAIPRGRVTHTTLAGTFPRRYRIRVDWDGDGTFGNAHADVTSRLVRMPTAKRGRNYASQIYGRSEAGYFEAVLQNFDGLYDRFNAGSDLVGLVVPGILVEYAVRRSGQSGYRVQWTGLARRCTAHRGAGQA